MVLVGRTAERKILNRALSSPSAELVAVYGRRRVGKTFLVRSVYEKHIAFELVGVHNAGMKDQLLNFSFALKRAMKSPVDIAVPSGWVAAFHALQNFLEPLVTRKKTVVFFDEFPWINTQKSNFLKAFDHFWNSWASRFPNLVVVICGSAASWMIRNIVNSKGGLHNRVTVPVPLMPFTLGETEQYLRSRKVKLKQYQVLQLYMALGGIPHYLKNIEPGESAAQAVDKLFFVKNAILKNEFANLYRALFDNPAHHEAVIRALARKGKGLSRNEIIEETGLSTGGTATKVLQELEESGFIQAYVPFGKTAKDAMYKLTDEYSLFYLRFVDKKRAAGQGTWLSLSAGAAWASWSGYAFETICFKHAEQVKKALGPVAYAEESVWRFIPPRRSKETGAQIDLLLDRKDNIINICEMKFTGSAFTITKAYAKELQNKINVFQDKTATRKTIHLTMITTYGVQKNTYYDEIVQSEVTMEALFA